MKMLVRRTGCNYALGIGIGVVLTVSVLSRSARADAQSDELVRLSKLSLSALECSVEARNEVEETRLFNIGLIAGRRFLDGLNVIGDVERNNASKEIAPIWFYKMRPSTDFIMGQVYQFVRRTVYDQIKNDNEESVKDHLYFQGHCAVIR